MKLVPALLQHHVHDRAAVVAELGGKAVVLDLEFLHDLDRRSEVHVGIAALALFRSADRTAVEGNLSGGVALTIGDKVGAGWIAEIRTRGLRHSAREKHQLKWIPAV